jgi:hypothetical protein
VRVGLGRANYLVAAPSPECNAGLLFERYASKLSSTCGRVDFGLVAAPCRYRSCSPPSSAREPFRFVSLLCADRPGTRQIAPNAASAPLPPERPFD